jgi:hypothetical protein
MNFCFVNCEKRIVCSVNCDQIEYLECKLIAQRFFCFNCVHNNCLVCKLRAE